MDNNKVEFGSVITGKGTEEERKFTPKIGESPLTEQDVEAIKQSQVTIDSDQSTIPAEQVVKPLSATPEEDLDEEKAKKPIPFIDVDAAIDTELEKRELKPKRK